MRQIVVLLALASCSPVAPAPGVGDPFARELAGHTPGPAQTCISAIPSQNLRVIDPQTIAYDRGSTLWVNRLEQPCPVLSPHNTLIIDASGGQYCRGDRIQGAEPGASIAGPVCTLRDWTPYGRP